MIRVQSKQLNTMIKKVNRGKIFAIIGPTGVGKTHLTNAYVPRTVRKLLKIREGEGMATLNTTTIVLTDYKNLNENQLIITGEFNPLTKKNRKVITECIKFIIDLIYEPTKKAYKQMCRNLSIDDQVKAFIDGVKKEIENTKNYNDNTKISYKIKNAQNYMSQLETVILNNEQIDLSKLVEILEDIYSRSEIVVKGEDIRRVFTDEVVSRANAYSNLEVNEQGDNTNNSFNNLDKDIKLLFNSIIDTVVDVYNSELNIFFKKLQTEGAEEIRDDESEPNAKKGQVDEGTNLEILKRIVEEEGKHFALVLDSDNYDEKILEEMIGVEENSKSYFIDDLTIYVKKDFEDFYNVDSGNNNETNNYFSVFTEDGKVYHSLRILDTQGLFHRDKTPDEESERIIDILNEHHCNDIIYVLSAKDDALTKKAKETLKHFKNSCHKNVNINLAVTHVDEKLTSLLSHDASDDFDDVEQFNDNHSELIEKYMEDQSKLLNQEFVDLKSKVNISPKIYYFSYPVHNNLDVYIKGKYDYTSNSVRLLFQVANNSVTHYFELLSDDMPILNIRGTISNIKGNNELIGKPYDASNIYIDIAKNVVIIKGTPKMPPLKIHHKTYNAALDNWQYCASKYISNSSGLSSGYAKIETYFVDYIRAFIRESMVKKLDIDYSKIKFKDDSEENKKLFKDTLMNFLSNHVSREVTIDIYNESVAKHRDSFDYSVDFHNILIQCIDTFFKSQSLSLVMDENKVLSNIECFKDYYLSDDSNGLAKIVMLMLIDASNAIDTFIRDYCVVKF